MTNKLDIPPYIIQYMGCFYCFVNLYVGFGSLFNGLNKSEGLTATLYSHCQIGEVLPFFF